jgi:hypothetical protein
MTIKKLESYFLIFMAVVLIANFITMLPFGAILVTVGLMTLAMIYFLSGMVATETGKDPGDNNPGKKAFGFDNFVNMVFAIFMIGALFTIQYWPNASFFINLSLVGLAIVVAVIAFKYSNGKSYNASLAKRAVAYLCFAIALAVLPRFTLLDIKYRSQPAYRDALKNSIEHPRDSAAREKLNLETKRLNEDK